MSWIAMLACIGCGPGEVASDGGGFGSTGTEAGGTTASADESSSGDMGGGDGDGDGDPAEVGETTETESGADDWTHPETETETETETGGEQVPAICERVWTHIDGVSSHGHIGATPIGGRSDGAFVSATPLLSGADEINVDAWMRSWSVSGDLEWEQLISWADHRDDLLALHYDDLGALFVAGRIDANTLDEDAMISALDGESGDVQWVVQRGAGGGYASLADNGAAVVAAGYIGEFGHHRLEVVALDPDTGIELWSAAPNLGPIDVMTRGLVFDDGLIDVLVADGSAFGSLSVYRFEPPAEEAMLLATLIEFDESLVLGDLERLGADRLAAVYGVGGRSYLTSIARDDGDIQDTLELEEVVGTTHVLATELVVTPTGLAIAGTAWDSDEDDGETFIAHFDEQLSLVCVGSFKKADLGVFHTPELRGLTVGPGSELVTGSYIVNSRQAVFARWQ